MFPPNMPSPLKIEFIRGTRFCCMGVTEFAETSHVSFRSLKFLISKVKNYNEWFDHAFKNNVIISLRYSPGITITGSKSLNFS